MKLGAAIEKLVENYNYAVGKEWVQDKVAWALYHTWKEADEHRAEQTEPNCLEKPNNCEDLQDWKDRMWAEAIVTEPTISKMEQVDKDINVRSKDEPQTKLCRECDDYAGNGMYCASNYIVYDFSTSRGNCESQNCGVKMIDE